MELFFLFLLGLAVGSFLLVVVDRLPRGESFFKGRSHCDHCKHTLSWKDLVPFFSFVFLNGRCRYCHKSLSIYYPLVELLTGILFVITYIAISHQSTYYLLHTTYYIATLLYFLFITCVLIVIFFTDLKSGIIPFPIVFPAIALVLLYILLTTDYMLPNHIFSALSAFLFFLILFLITRGRGMGFGDVVLAFFMGLLLGFPSIIVAFYIAFLTGTFISLILIIGKKKRFFGSTIPFGPFLIFGTYIAMFWGDKLIDYFWRLAGI